MKSSFAWRLLTEPDNLENNIEALYPGQGVLRAVAVDNRKGSDPSSFDASEANGDTVLVEQAGQIISAAQRMKHSGSVRTIASYSITVAIGLMLSVMAFVAL